MSQCLRKQIMNNCTWYDKEIEAHKHDFSIECVLEEKNPDIKGNNDIYQSTYSNVMMCSKCHSFTKSKDYVKNRIYTFDNDKDLEAKKLMEDKMLILPKIVAYRNNRNFEINYKHIIFPDKYEYIDN